MAEKSIAEKVEANTAKPGSSKPRKEGTSASKAVPVSHQDIERIVRAEMSKIEGQMRSNLRGDLNKIGQDLALQVHGLSTLLVRGLGAMGLEEDAIRSIVSEAQGEIETQTAKAKAKAYDEGQSTQEVMSRHLAQVAETQGNVLAKIGKRFGVEIPMDHPDLQGPMSPDRYIEVAMEIAEKLAIEKTSQGGGEEGGTESPEVASKKKEIIESGALDQIGEALDEGRGPAIDNLKKDPMALLKAAFPPITEEQGTT